MTTWEWNQQMFYFDYEQTVQKSKQWCKDRQHFRLRSFASLCSAVQKNIISPVPKGTESNTRKVMETLKKPVFKDKILIVCRGRIISERTSDIKPGFHMSGKTQTIGDFTLFRPPQILPINRICARGLSQIFPGAHYRFRVMGSWFSRLWTNYLFVIGGLEPSKGIGNERNPSPTDADVPDGTNLTFHLSGMIADHRRNLRRVGKIETLPILQICPRSFPDDRGYLRFRVFI